MTRFNSLARTLTVCIVPIVTLTAAFVDAGETATRDTKLKALWWENNDFKWVRGANYIPSYAINGVEIWNEYDPEVVDRELSHAAGIHLNSLRIWMNYFVYELDPQRYLKNYEDLIARCAEYGIRPMFILFDGCFGEADPDLVNKGWMPNPGPTRMLPDYRDKLKEYLDDVVGRYVSDPRILMWDIMNEPSSMGMPQLTKGDPEFAYDFARNMADYVREIDRTHPATIGVGNHSHIPGIVDHVDVVTFHVYQPFERAFDMEIPKARELANGKACIITETEANSMGSTPDVTFRKFKEHDIGWYFFSLVMGELSICLPGGLFDTNGVVYYPDYFVAVMGFTVPKESQRERFDRFRIAEIFEEAKTVPTNEQNFDQRNRAAGEMGRSLAWAGVDMKAIFKDLVGRSTEMHMLVQEGKKAEAYKLLDKNMAVLGKLAEDNAFFSSMYVPTTDEMTAKWKQ